MEILIRVTADIMFSWESLQQSKALNIPDKRILVWSKVCNFLNVWAWRGCFLVRVTVIKPISAQLCFRLSFNRNRLHKMLRSAPYKKLKLEDFFQEVISSKCTILPENGKINRCWYSHLMSQVLWLTCLNAPRLACTGWQKILNLFRLWGEVGSNGHTFLNYASNPQFFIGNG